MTRLEAILDSVQAGVVIIDPDDRRRRLLIMTVKGKVEWAWQLKYLNKIFFETEDRMRQLSSVDDRRTAEQILDRMSREDRDVRKM